MMLQRLAEELNIRDSVAFTGLVKQEELPCFYSAADVCVIPSYYESFGLVALESLACGTPVVATRVGGVESIVWDGDAGYVVPDNSPPHLAQKIAQVLDNREQNTVFTASIRASVGAFAWSNIAGVVVEECEAMIIGSSAQKH